MFCKEQYYYSCIVLTDEVGKLKYYPCLSILWTIFTALLASACCIIQLVINIFINSCAGFAKLKPFRPVTIPIAIFSLILTWFISYKRRRTCACHHMKESVTVSSFDPTITITSPPHKRGGTVSHSDSDQSGARKQSHIAMTPTQNATDFNEVNHSLDGAANALHTETTQTTQEDDDFTVTTNVTGTHSGKSKWWMIPLFCTILSLILIPMPEFVDMINHRESASVDRAPLQFDEIQYQLPLRCEACAFNVKRKLLRQFGDDIESVSCEVNFSEPLKSKTTVYYKPEQIASSQITEYLLNSILKTHDRPYFKVLHERTRD